MSNWTYSQKTGAMTDPSGEVVAIGYSGAPGFVNRPLAEGREDEGPIPSGTYRIEAACTHETCGPVSLPLTPDPNNEMHGRSGFLIHGDTESMDQSASTGCIILPRAIRDEIAASECRQLVVTV